MRPAELIDACCDSHQRLLTNVVPLTDADVRSPSLLPGYSRAHVIAHITNKANAHVSLFEGAIAGECRRLHPVGYDPDQAAGAGADRPVTQLLADLRTTFERLVAAWEQLDPTSWDRQAVMTAGPRTMTEVVTHHLRNVEVQHVDLDIGYQCCDWPSIFVEGELTKRLRSLPERADHAQLLAWLLNRAAAVELDGAW